MKYLMILITTSFLFASDCDELRKENLRLKQELAQYKKADTANNDKYIQKGGEIIDDAKDGAKWTLGKSSELVGQGVDKLKNWMD
ncbi:MAG: hypothetical protein U9N59_12255, partial [Campylobacterota bacterium]|nr:hypothetical protein [Campylobacterota bacterium]